MFAKSIFAPLLIACFCATLQAQEITVMGTGSVEVETDIIVISSAVVGTGDTFEEAIASYNQRKQKIVDALNGMDFPDVELNFKQQSFQKLPENENMVDMFGADTTEQMKAFTIQEEVDVEMKFSADKMDSFMKRAGEVIDAMETAESQFGPNQMEAMYSGNYVSNLFVGKCSDKKAAEKQAYAKAFADAKRRAQELADLAGVELDGVLAISDESELHSPSYDYSYTPFGSVEKQSIGKVSIIKMLDVKFKIK